MSHKIVEPVVQTAICGYLGRSAADCNDVAGYWGALAAADSVTLSSTSS